MEGDVYETSGEYIDRFDLILVTVGALCWMEDIGLFFHKVAACLKPGGVLLVYEIHPITNMFAIPEESFYDPEQPTKLVNSYFRKEPYVDTLGMPYLAGQNYESKPFISFSHTMGDVVTGVAQSGLRVERLTEYDHDCGGIAEAAEGKGAPLSFLLLARKA